MTIPQAFLMLGVLVTAGVAGCGAADRSPVYAPSPTDVVDVDAPPASRDANINLVAYQPGAATAGTAKAPAERKIIFNATLDVVVDDFAAVPEQIKALAAAHGAFISKSNLDASSGEERRGTWTLRVPVEQYDGLVGAAGRIGELARSVEESREVTAEYHDLESRLRNKEREEARLLEHLQSETGNLEQILVVEKELSRVRTEAEQMAGQLRLLQDLTALSTVTLNVSETKEYVPVEPPTFVARIGETWTMSLGGLQQVGQVVVLVAVALAPWALVAFVPALLGLALYRRTVRPRAAA